MLLISAKRSFLSSARKVAFRYMSSSSIYKDLNNKVGEKSEKSEISFNENILENSSQIVEEAAAKLSNPERGFYLTDIARDLVSSSDSIGSLTTFIQDSLISVHAYTGFSYPLLLVGCAVTARLSVTPLLVRTIKLQDKLIFHTPYLKSRFEEIRESELRGASKAEIGEKYAELQRYQKENGVSPIGGLGFTLLQLVCTSPFFLACSQLHERIDLTGAGPAFATNLGSPSLLCMLLIVTPYVLTMENALKANPRLSSDILDNTRYLMIAFFGFSLVTSFFIPASMQFFIFGAMSFQTLFTRLMLVPQVRAWLSLRPLPPLPKEYTNLGQWILVKLSKLFLLLVRK